jgi:hypothetical protein
VNSNIELLTASLDAAPGEVLAAMVRVQNTSTLPVTYRATPIGLGDDLGDVWKAQALVVPANSVADLPVQIPVPPSFGIGHHAVAIEVDTGAGMPVLLPLTLAIASVERVELRATPSPMRGRRKVKFVLDVVNREPHTVQLVLEADTPDVDVSFETPTMTLGPGEHSWTRARVRGPRKLVGDTTQHNLKLVARGRAASSSIAVPYVQRPVFVYRLRSAVAVVAVLSLWMGAMVLVSQRYIFNKTNDDVSAETTNDVELAGDDGSVPTPGAADPGTDDGSDGTAESGDASASDESGDAGGGDESGDAGGGDSSASDESGGDGTGEAGSPDGTEGPTADTPVEVRGTIDVVGGGIDGVTITPAPMSLKNVAELDPNVTSFAATSRQEPRKIWSARGIIAPVEPVRLAQTEPIPAGDFAPDADGIWALPLAQRQSYELAFSKPGFQTQAFVITPELGNTPELAVELEPATGELGGVVTGGGNPLENVVLLITTGTFDYQTVTDGNGRWALTGLDTSVHYTIVASLDGYGATVRRVRLAPGEPQTNVLIALPFGQSVLQGNVTDTLGNPVAGAKVTATSGAESRSTTTLTDAESLGSYQLPQLETNATYSVTIELEGYETTTTKIQVGSLTQVENFTLKALAAQISGRVISDDGKPIGGATVRLDIDSVMEPISSVQTVAADDGKGEFNLGLVPPGSYELTVTQWQHELTRLELVVTSAAQATLSGDSSLVFTEGTGISFEIEMEGKDTRITADRPLGALAFDIIDSNPNPSNCERTVDLCRRIQDVTIEIRTTDGGLNKLDTFAEGVFLCQTETGLCNNGTGDNFIPEIGVGNIPIGTYRVTFSSPEFNTVTETYTVLPRPVSVEDVEMIRKGELVGSFVDSTDTTASLWTNQNVFIVSASNFGSCPPGVVQTVCGARVQTEPVPNSSFPQKFQSDSEDLLTPGTWGIQVVAPEGYFVRPNQVLVDGLDPFTFVVGNSPGVFNQIEVVIGAVPYPAVSMRVFKPVLDFAVDEGFERFPTDTVVSASMTCGSTASQTVTSSSGLIEFDKFATQKLDTNNDGVFGTCEITVSAPGFDDVTYPFGEAQANGTKTASLKLAADRFIDIGLAATRAGGVGELAGLLSWIEPGAPNATPIVGANIAATEIITALIAGERTESTQAADTAAIVPFRESLDPQQSVRPPGTPPGTEPLKAEWNLGGGKEQILGSTTLTFTDLPGVAATSGTVTIIVNGAGEEIPQYTYPLEGRRVNGKIDVVQNPVQGTLVGQVTIITKDPNPAYVEGMVESKLPGSSDFVAICCPSAGPGSYNLDGFAGTWTTKINVPDNHVRLSDTSPAIVDLTPFGEVSQIVPPGGISEPYTPKLLEQGELTIEVNGNATIEVDGNELVRNGGVLPTVFGLDVPTDIDGGTLLTAHTFSVTEANGFDISAAEVAVTERFNNGSTLVKTDLLTFSGDPVKVFSLPFSAGTKYDVVITLPAFGSVGGTIVGDSTTNDVSTTGEVIICQNSILPTVVAVPTDGDGGVDDLSRPRLENVGTSSECGDFTLSGAPGWYRLDVTHPEFSPTSIPFEMRNNPSPNDDLSPTITLLQSELVITVQDVPAPDQLDLTTHVYYTLNGMAKPLPIDTGIVRVDPGRYVLEVRHCDSVPNNPSNFEACVGRFPVKVSELVVGRTNSEVGQTTVNVNIPFLKVGGKIELDVSLVNAANDPEDLCPTSGTAVGNFVRTFQRRTGQEVTAEVTAGTEPVTTIAVTTDEGSIVETRSGDCNASVMFDDFVASGLHTISIPAVAGYGKPVLTADAPSSIVNPLSTQPDGSYTATIGYLPDSWAVPAKIFVTYTAAKVDVLLQVCGEEPTSAGERCSDDFPNLSVSLETPAPSLRVYSDFQVDQTTSGHVKILSVDPSLNGYTVNVTDDLHIGPASGLLFVDPGLQARQTVTVPGAKILVEVHPLRQDAPSPSVPTPIGANDSSDIKFELFGSNDSTTWTLLTTTWDPCPRGNEMSIRLCFNVDALYGKLKVVVSDDIDVRYMEGEAIFTGAPLGSSVILEPTTDKRALLRVRATMAAAGDLVPAELDAKVQLRVVGGSAAAVGDRVSRPGCTSSGVATACFEFYVDPGPSYQGFADGLPAYLEADGNGTVLATIGMVSTDVLSVQFAVNPPPAAPGVPTLTSRDTSIFVAWSAPAPNGGTEILDYTVTEISDSSKTCTATVSLPLSCTVTGLTNGTPYNFTVVARNVAGSGLESLEATAAKSPDVAPGAPGAPTLTSRDTSIFVAWSAPAPNGGTEILDYTVTEISDSSKTCTATVSLPLSCTVTGLTNGTPYTFAVVARNAAGPGSSATATATPLGPLVAAKPAVDSTGNTAVTVTWADADAGGATITGYTVTAISDSSKTCTATVSLPLSCTVANLTSGDNYTFKVTATDNASRTADSLASDAVTAGAPSKVSVLGEGGGDTVVNETDIVLKWVKFRSRTLQGPAPLYYTISMIPTATCTIQTRNIEDEEKCDATGLTSSTEYTFTVTATNDNGTSVPTVVSFTTDAP